MNQWRIFSVLASTEFTTTLHFAFMNVHILHLLDSIVETDIEIGLNTVLFFIKTC